MYMCVFFQDSVYSVWSVHLDLCLCGSCQFLLSPHGIQLPHQQSHLPWPTLLKGSDQ